MKNRGRTGKIEVEGLEYHVPAGYYTRETPLLQKIVISFGIKVEFPPDHEFRTLSDTVSYEPLIEAINRVMEEKRYALIEEIASRILDSFRAALGDYPWVRAVTVSVQKVPLSGERGPSGSLPTASITLTEEWEQASSSS